MDGRKNVQKRRLQVSSVKMQYLECLSVLSGENDQKIFREDLVLGTASNATKNHTVFILFSPSKLPVSHN